MVALALAESLSKTGHKVDVITSTEERGESSRVYKEKGYSVYRIFSAYNMRWRAYFSLYNPMTVRRVKHILTELKPDVVLVHNVHLHLSYHSLRLAKKTGAVVVLVAHDVMLYNYGKAEDGGKASWLYQLRINRWRYNPFRNLVIRYYLRFVDRIVAVSHALQQALEKNGIGNISIIPNAINVEEWDSSQTEVDSFRQKFSLTGKKVILWGGRLHESKGGVLAVDSLAKSVISIPETILFIVGKQNPYTNYLAEYARTLGVRDNIIFSGWLDGGELKSAFAASDIILIPSQCFETFGMMALEAMAAKKPVIATDKGGISEIVQDGTTGFIVNPCSSTVFIDKVVALLTNPGLARSFGINGYERVLKHFSLSEQVNSYLTLFSQLLKHDVPAKD